MDDDTTRQRFAGSGPLLRAIRARIDRLADAAGQFRVAAASTGVSPVPVDGLRFPDRETARRAARLTTAYRARLRQWDERTPVYELVVHEGAALTVPTDAPAPSTGLWAGGSQQ